jgi:hypothetical protein
LWQLEQPVQRECKSLELQPAPQLVAQLALPQEQLVQPVVQQVQLEQQEGQLELAALPVLALPALLQLVQVPRHQIRWK